MIGHAGILHLLPYRMPRYNESKLWCQVCTPLQDESPYPTIEARPMLWVELAISLQSGGGGPRPLFSQALSTSDVADVSMAYYYYYYY